MKDSARRAVFFDLDDTLYDHLSPLRATLRDVLQLPDESPYGEIYHKFRYYSDILSAQQAGSFSTGQVEVMENIRTRRFVLTLADFGIEINEVQARALQQDYLGRQYDIEMFEGAGELIQELLNHGIEVGIITNGTLQHQQNKLQALMMDKLLPANRIFVSGAVGFDKPDVQLFTHVNDQLGIPAERCIYVGDSWRNDVVGATEANWTTIWFNYRGAEPETLEHQPDYIAHNYSEVADIVRRLIV